LGVKREASPGARLTPLVPKAVTSFWKRW
jgi:hypothetical protein